MPRTLIQQLRAEGIGIFLISHDVFDLADSISVMLLESGDRIELVSAPDCGPLIERFMNKPAPEPLSQAALEVLSIVA